MTDVVHNEVTMHTLAALCLLLQIDPPARAFDVVGPAVQQLAISLEILDVREIRYVMARAEDIPADLSLLRRRFADLRDAPPADDANRFPPRSLISELLAFNRAYQQYLYVRTAGEPARAGELKEAINETERLYCIWDNARDGCCPYYYVTVRRAALNHLRELIGWESYYRGELPPHVPVWRFEAIP